MYNLICACSFVIVLALSFLLGKTRKSELILRIASLVIFIYKSYFYVLENVSGNLKVPVEISSITYFLMCIILIFKIKSLYSVGAFYGTLAGLGYFTFYILLGFTVQNNFNTTEILIGCFSHGFLLVSGLHLFKTNQFAEQDKSKIWIAIFAMLSWALVFYDMQMRGITFIYYIIKPTFLYIFENMSLNVILLMLYYAILVTLYHFVIKAFFKLNNKYAFKQSLQFVKNKYIS